MPALTVFRHLTTKPFAGDDLQIVCLVLGAYRVIQIICLVPLIIVALLNRFNGYDLLVNGYPCWCPQYTPYLEANTVVQTVNQYEKQQISRGNFMYQFVILSTIFLVVDISWMVMVWVAASAGTPTQPKGRDEYLRKLIVFKMFIIDCFPIALIIVGCLKVNELRKNNYGCGDQPLVAPPPDSGVFYVFFCVLIVSFALELLVWPAISANKIMRLIRSHKVIRRGRYATKAKGERLEQCLGSLLKCISVCCCNKQGGKEIKNQGEMKDFASNLMEFANNDTSLDLVLSDMYVGLKLLARVQAERRHNTIMLVQQSSNEQVGRENISDEKKQSATPIMNRRTLLSSVSAKRRRSILTLQTAEDGDGFISVEKNVLSNSNPEDVEILRLSAHYCNYAECIYVRIYDLALEDLLPPDATSFIRDFGMMEPMDRFSLAKVQMPHSQLFYANFYSGIAATPYAILVDEKEKSVVITVRGTKSLEDWVIDLQYVPQPLDDVGELCGFNGAGHHCHKGVSTRCKWMYNDIKRSRVLKQLYSDGSAYKDYNLVVVGHSLGGGCAQVLSLMLRPSFPSLRCFAYEPPGCIFDDLLCEDCKEWIISIVRHDDVVPRVTQHNLEKLRDEFFDVLARIKVPKYHAFHDVRAHCPEFHLAARNAKILCPKHLIDRSTEFHKRVQAFRSERAAKNQSGEVSVKLYIPGRIIHLVDTTGDETKYVPYWDSRYEFNQVILSSRILADHDIQSLPDLLAKINLDESHEVNAWVIQNDDEVDLEEDVSFIVPCSNPQGKMPVILLVFIVAACILAIFSIQGCKFVSRSAILQPLDGQPSFPILSLDTGLWSYNLMQCIDGQVCNNETVVDVSHYVESDYCYPYAMVFQPNSYWVAARAFGSLTVLTGLFGFVFIATATCCKLRKRTWFLLCAWFLLVTMFQGLQFLIMKGDLCTELSVPGLEPPGEVISQCTIARDGFIGIAAMITWFAIAVGCSHMARRSNLI